MPERAGDHLPYGRPDMADVEPEQQVAERPLLRALDGGHEVLHRHLAEALEVTQLPDASRQLVDVAHVVEQAGLDEHADGPLAEALDVHRAPRPEVHDTRPGLCRAIGIDTPSVTFALRPHEGLLADRAHRRELPFSQALGTQRKDRPDDLGDHVAGLAHNDRVAGPHVLQAHLILVVQRGHPNRGTAHEHWLQLGERRGLAGAADRHVDGEKLGGALLGRELVGDRPPRRLARDAELGPLVEIVDLDDCAVDLVRQVVAVLLPIHAVPEDVVERAEHLDGRVDREAAIGQERERLRVGPERRPALNGAQLVAEERELAPGGDVGILLPQAARRRVPRVGEQGLARFGPALVQGRECVDRHEDLTANLEHGGYGPTEALRGGRRGLDETLGHGRDGPHVLGHVLSDQPVAARRRACVAAVSVQQRHRQPVDLQFAYELHGDV